MKTLLLVFLALHVGLLSVAQRPAHLVRPGDTLKKDAFINTVEQSLQLFLAEYANHNNYDSVIKALNYEQDDIPEFSDEVYCKRLEKLNEMSPFHLDCNPITLSTIKFFVNNRRGFVKVVLGRSALYFDLFEEKLAEYGLPVELKYLSVIESGLRPQVKSRAGALGLWQFMYGTGLYYGLKENSYIDERMDPVLATDAACRYLKQLYGIYGDWNLALAAYNAGPGNVNKAIRRSGNKTTYWEVRPFLPAETQGYVPNFIAATYLLSYHAEHNIIPLKPNIHFAQLDTMCLTGGVHMQTISKLVKWDVEDIKTLNPIYKSNFIPSTKPSQCISGPLDKIGMLVSLEDSLYALEESMYSPQPVSLPTPPVLVPPVVTDSLGDTMEVATNPPNLESYIYHKVKAGETMHSISTRYGVTIEQILEWNALRTSNIYVGQRLKLKASTTSTTPAPQPVVTTPPRPVKKYYTVRSGDTFSRVADKYNLSQNELSKLNPRVNINRLTVGQRLRVR
jgi:membrane-bound lytic murein transglycosylase D